MYCVLPEVSHCFLLSQSSSQMRSLPLLRVIEYRYVGDGVGAKKVVPSNSRSSSETPDSGEDAVDLGDMVSGVSVQQDSAWLLDLTGGDISLKALGSLELAANRRMEAFKRSFADGLNQPTESRVSLCHEK
jgi:hypothetical protein